MLVHEFSTHIIPCYVQKYVMKWDVILYIINKPMFKIPCQRDYFFKRENPLHALKGGNFSRNIVEEIFFFFSQIGGVHL